jgi:AcrR family transcriptional regulator
MPTPTPSKRRGKAEEEVPVRQRILSAAFSAFTEAGYAEASTLEIASRARVSKRELYAVVGNKQEMLVACIRDRATRLQAPANLPEPRNRDELERVLVGFGTQLLRETTDATVVAVFRLAIAEAVRTPEVARALDSIGRQTSRAALMAIMAQAQSRGLLSADPAEMAEQFAALLWGDLMISLLLGSINPPSPREITRQARRTATAFLQLHPDREHPVGATRPAPAANCTTAQ